MRLYRLRDPVVCPSSLLAHGCCCCCCCWNDAIIIIIIFFFFQKSLGGDSSLILAIVACTHTLLHNTLDIYIYIILPGRAVPSLCRAVPCRILLLLLYIESICYWADVLPDSTFVREREERRGEKKKKKKKKRVGVKSSASGVGTRESSFNGGVDSSAHSDAEPKNKPYRLLEEEEEQTHARGGSVRTALHYSPSPSPSRECCEDHRSPHHVLAPSVRPSVRPSSRPPVLPSASLIPTNKTITNKSTLRRGMKPSGFFLSRLSTAPFFLC